jgi:hypothetical protein
MTLFLALTNDLHHLLWGNADLLAGIRFPELSISYGPWFWVHAAFSFLLLLSGSIQLARIIAAAPGIDRRHAIPLLLGACLPWIASLLYALRISPFYPLNPTPVALVASVLLLACVMLSWRFFQIGLFTHGAII